MDGCGALVAWYWSGMTELLRETVPISLCPPQIQHELAWDRTRAFTVRGWGLTDWAVALSIVVLKNYVLVKYKYNGSLSLNRLWAVLEVRRTTGLAPQITRLFHHRNAGHSLQYLSTGQEWYRAIGCQWYCGYFAIASNRAHFTVSWVCATRKWHGVKTSWLFRFLDCQESRSSDRINLPLTTLFYPPHKSHLFLCTLSVRCSLVYPVCSWESESLV